MRVAVRSSGMALEERRPGLARRAAGRVGREPSWLSTQNHHYHGRSCARSIGVASEIGTSSMALQKENTCRACTITVAGEQRRARTIGF